MRILSFLVTLRLSWGVRFAVHKFYHAAEDIVHAKTINPDRLIRLNDFKAQMPANAQHAELYEPEIVKVLVEAANAAKKALQEGKDNPQINADIVTYEPLLIQEGEEWHVSSKGLAVIVEPTDETFIAVRRVHLYTLESLQHWWCKRKMDPLTGEEDGYVPRNRGVQVLKLTETDTPMCEPTQSERHAPIEDPTVEHLCEAAYRCDMREFERFLQQLGPAGASAINTRGSLALHRAARGGCMGAVSQLLPLMESDIVGMPIDDRLGTQFTALHEAVLGKHAGQDLIGALVDHMTNTALLAVPSWAAHDVQGLNALQIGSRIGNVVAVRVLVEKMHLADVKAPSGYQGKTALHCAADDWRQGQPGNLRAIVGALLGRLCPSAGECDLASIWQRDTLGLSPLHRAVRFGARSFVLEFLENEILAPLIHFDVKSFHGLTVLHEAAVHGEFDIFNDILGHMDSDSNRQAISVLNNRGQSALQLIISFRYPSYDSLRATCTESQINAVRNLLTKISAESIAQQDAFGKTSLHDAATSGCSEFVPLICSFVDKKAKFLDIKDSSGFTALHLAVIVGDGAAMNKLLAEGASKTIQNSQGKTPYDIAYAKKFYAMAFRLKWR